MMSGIALPAEILSQIFGSLPVSDLLSISLVSRLCRHEGQRLIFRDSGPLLINHGLPGVKFLDAMTLDDHSTRLALFVRSLELNIKFPGYCDERTISLVRKIERTLTRVVNLKTLRIFGYLGLEPLNSIPYTLLKCTFRLHTLDVAYHPLNEIPTSSFIHQQRDVTDLSINGCYLLAPDSCSLLFGLGLPLESLSSSLDGVGSVMTGSGLANASHLRYLRCTGGWDPNHSPSASDGRPFTQELLHALPNIRLLDSGSGEFLCNCASYLKKVTLVRLWYYDHLDLTQKILDALGQLPALHVLVLSSWESPQHKDGMAEIVANVFACCPKLQYVDDQFDKTDWLKHHYPTERYTRKSGHPGVQKEKLVSNEEEYSWATRHRFVRDE